jgi:mannose/fructose/N-acetylgalactosamine-specific phosphotransferase system component IIC
VVPDLLTLLLLSLLGGLLALDATSAGQLMVSRPLIAAALAGVVAGDVEAGIVVGVLLEALHLAVLPVGAARYPEAGPAAVAAAGAFAWATESNVALLASVLFMLAWGFVGGRTVEALRRVNARLAVPPPGPVDLRTVERLHLGALALDFARGCALTLAGVLVLGTLLETLGWIPFREPWTQPALALSAAAALASSLRLFGRRRLPLFLAGAAAGALLLWVR